MTSGIRTHSMAMPRSSQRNHRRPARWVVSASIVASALAAGLSAQTSKTRTYVETLASEKLEGRLAGSNGERLAADYIVGELQKIGAKPLPGLTDFRMPFEFTAGTKDAGST
ncbi:MAG TPA: hypothetical protein VGG73_19745, partial [Vicinamibacterales bacterium]